MVVHVSQTKQVAHIELDRVAAANAVDLDTLVELHHALDELSEARVVVVSGRGKHFCAGADLGGVEGDHFHRALSELLHRLRDFPGLTICAAHNATLGLGAQLAIMCDLRTATATTRFGVPAAKLGIMVDQFTVRRLMTTMGSSVARLALLTGQEMSGEQAHALGFVHRLCEPGESLHWATELSALAPLAVAAHKRSLNDLEDRLETSPELAEVFSAVWASKDASEGPAAFKDRRPPNFTGT